MGDFNFLKVSALKTGFLTKTDLRIKYFLERF